jgi:phosphatidylglycerophosphatase A
VNGFLLWIAQGFGIGRIPVAPGTFGSVLGLFWGALLLLTGNWGCFMGGCVAGFGVSVWLGGKAERILGQKDPGSVVLDEITAMPVCFLGWISWFAANSGSMPRPEDFVSQPAAWVTIGIFVAFRIFDIAKPWPVRQSQALPGGWGLTIDDFLAALYVNGVVLAVYAGEFLLRK